MNTPLPNSRFPLRKNLETATSNQPTSNQMFLPQQYVYQQGNYPMPSYPQGSVINSFGSNYPSQMTHQNLSLPQTSQQTFTQNTNTTTNTNTNTDTNTKTNPNTNTNPNLNLNTNISPDLNSRSLQASNNFPQTSSRLNPNTNTIISTGTGPNTSTGTSSNLPNSVQTTNTNTAPKITPNENKNQSFTLNSTTPLLNQPQGNNLNQFYQQMDEKDRQLLLRQQQMYLEQQMYYWYQMQQYQFLQQQQQQQQNLLNQENEKNDNEKQEGTNKSTNPNLAQQYPPQMGMQMPMGMGMPMQMGTGMQIPMGVQMPMGMQMPMGIGMGMQMPMNMGMQGGINSTLKTEKEHQDQSQKKISQQELQNMKNNNNSLEYLKYQQQQQQNNLKNEIQLNIKKEINPNYSQQQQQLQQQQQQQTGYLDQRMLKQEQEFKQGQTNIMGGGQRVGKEPEQVDQIISMSVDDALLYLDEVREKFQHKPDVYDNFLSIMKEFKDQTIDTPGVISRVTRLFKDEKDLILKFNQFLPEEFRVRETDISQKVEELNTAINYVNKIKNRFSNKSQVYRTFLDILQHFQQDKMSIQTVFKKVRELFNGHDDLILAFEKFLPAFENGARQGNQNQNQNRNMDQYQNLNQSQFTNQPSVSNQNLNNYQNQFPTQNNINQNFNNFNNISLNNDNNNSRKRQYASSEIDVPNTNNNNNNNNIDQNENSNDNILNSYPNTYYSQQQEDQQQQQQSKNDKVDKIEKFKQFNGKIRIKTENGKSKMENENLNKKFFKTEKAIKEELKLLIRSKEKQLTLEEIFFLILKKYLKKNEFEELLRVLHLYIYGPISKYELIQLLSPILILKTPIDQNNIESKNNVNSNKVLLEMFKQYIFYGNLDFDNWENGVLIPLKEFDRDHFKHSGHSYYKLPKEQIKKPSSGMGELEKQVLNFEWFSRSSSSIPTEDENENTLETENDTENENENENLNGTETKIENENFYTNHEAIENGTETGNEIEKEKENYNEIENSEQLNEKLGSFQLILCEIEEKRMELDLNVSKNERLIKYLKNEYNKIRNDKSNQNTHEFKWLEDSLNIRCLIDLYGKNINVVLDGLKKRAILTIPVVVKRLEKQKTQFMELQNRFEKLIDKWHIDLLILLFEKKQKKLQSLMKQNLKHQNLNPKLFLINQNVNEKESSNENNNANENRNINENENEHGNDNTMNGNNNNISQKDNSHSNSFIYTDLELLYDINDLIKTLTKNSQKYPNSQEQTNLNNNNPKNQSSQLFSDAPIIKMVNAFINDFLLKFFIMNPKSNENILNSPIEIQREKINEKSENNINNNNNNNNINNNNNNETFNGINDNENKKIEIEKNKQTSINMNSHMNTENLKLESKDYELLFASNEFYRFFFIHFELYKQLFKMKDSLNKSNSNNNNKYQQFVKNLKLLFKGRISKKKYLKECQNLFSNNSYYYSNFDQICVLAVEQLKALLFNGSTNVVLNLYHYERNKISLFENVYSSNYGLIVGKNVFFKFEFKKFSNSSQKSNQNRGGRINDNNNDDDADVDPNSKDEVRQLKISIVETKIENQSRFQNHLQKRRRVNEKIVSQLKSYQEINEQQFVKNYHVFLHRNATQWKKQVENATKKIIIVNQLEQKFKLDTLETKFIEETEDFFYRLNCSRNGWKVDNINIEKNDSE
ncbi:sin3a isoform g [Anaeramoeba flamelloides]|uniref:Sin3a isoform g n=1 Tax=Anaeramoeba flamelloides TaxID=1746091 RepID=A0AAV7YJ97_9EUKA|nr:sin3a isoform g [Anaeramoeba flamelloides]